jgi:hypothetical protein
MVSIRLPADVIHALLRQRGWTITPAGRNDRLHYVRPGHPSWHDGGKFGDDFLWRVEEAVTAALTDEARA